MRGITQTIWLLLLLVFTGCTENQPEYVKAAYQVRSDYVNRILPKYELRCEGYGESFMGDVKRLEVMFVAAQKMDIEQARGLAISVTQEFLNDINSNDRIRPFLHDSPFTSKNLRIGLSFSDPDRGGELHPPYIALIWVMQGKVYYFCYDHEAPINKRKYIDTYAESYEEALELVRKQHPNDPLYQ